MFVVNPVDDDHPVILDVGKERRTLAELGVGNLTDIAIFDSDINPDNNSFQANNNKAQLYNIIGERYGIDKKEYEALIPTITAAVNEENPANTPTKQDFFQDSPSKPMKNGVPPEY